MDRAVEPEEDEAIKKAIAENSVGIIGVHDLRTRRAGSAAFIDFHVVVPAPMTVREAHDICDRLEDAIRGSHTGCQPCHSRRAGRRKGAWRQSDCLNKQEFSMSVTDVSSLSQLGAKVDTPESPEKAILERCRTAMPVPIMWCGSQHPNSPRFAL